MVDKAFKIMTFGFYIRNALEMSQYILISAISEIYGHNTSSLQRLISFVFACIFILAFISMVIFINYLIFLPYKIHEKEHSKLEEFFCGLKEDKKRRF